jgi:hypothetical protein
MSGQQSLLVCQGDERVSPFFSETFSRECFDLHSMSAGRKDLPQQLA